MIPACIVAVLLLSPVLLSGFYGDDYVLWHLGVQLLRDPGHLFIGPGNFYRPANTWLFGLNHLLFGTNPLGYHVVTLAMHLLCGMLLGFLLRRFVSSPWALFASTAIWMCSPYSFEPIQYVNVAYNDLTVLLVWLGQAVLWPRPCQRWTRGRLASVVALAIVSVFCKESWVILPGLIAAFDLFLAGVGLRRSAWHASLAAIPAAAYTLAYSRLFPGRADYYDFGFWAASKIPHLWASFCQLTTLSTYKCSFGVPELVASALLLGCCVIAVARRSHCIGLGLSLFFLSTMPVLFIPFASTRYTTVPLVGFVIAMTGVARAAVAGAAAWRRQLAAAVASACVVVYFSLGVRVLFGDIQDMGRTRFQYAVLLAEAGAFADQIPIDRPVVWVRLERLNPLFGLRAEGSFGIPKVYFQRDLTPYGLADWAPLFSFVRFSKGGEILSDLVPHSDLAGRPYAVVAHAAGRFLRLDPRASGPVEEVDLWRWQGHHAGIIGPWHARGEPRDSPRN